MALQSIVGGLPLCPLPVFQSGTPTISGDGNLVLSSASQQCGFVFGAPKTGNIRFVAFNLPTVSSAPSSNHDIRLETVSTSTGLNSGSLVGTNTNVSALLNSTGWKSNQLTADAAVTAGQALALMVVAPGANFGNIRLGVFSDDYSDWPYARTTASGKVALAPCIALEYDDGTVGYLPGTWPIDATTSSGIYGNATNPNKRGIRFRLPFTARLAGVHIWGDLDGDFDIVLYSGGTSASTLLSGVDKDLRGTTTGGVYKYVFTTTATLSANTYYRLVVVPTSATGVELYGVTVNAAKYLDALPGGQDLHYTTVNGTPSAEGDWTNTLTQRVFLSPWFDQFDDGVQLGGESSYVTLG